MKARQSVIAGGLQKSNRLILKLPQNIQDDIGEDPKKGVDSKGTTQNELVSGGELNGQDSQKIFSPEKKQVIDRQMKEDLKKTIERMPKMEMQRREDISV